MRNFFILILILTSLSFSKIGEWKTYSHIGKGYEIKSIDEDIILSAHGGLVKVNDNNIEVLDTDDGLYSIDVRSSEVDFRGVLWVANTEGGVTLFDAESSQIKYIKDLEEGSFNLLKVISSDYYVYLLTETALFRYSYDDVADRYDRKDMLTLPNIKDLIIKDGVICLLTSETIYDILESEENISYLPLWNNNNIGNASSPKGIFQFENEILVTAENGLFKLSNNNLIPSNILSGYSIGSYFINNDELYLATYDDIVGSSIFYTIYELENLNSQPIAKYDGSLEGNFDLSFVVHEDKIYMNRKDNGMVVYDTISQTESSLDYQTPPLGGFNKAIQADNGNILYSNTYNIAIFDLDKKIWSESLYSHTYQSTNIMLSSDSKLYIAQWGGGVEVLKYENDSLLIYIENLVSDNFEYPVNPDVFEDDNGNIWFSGWSFENNEQGSINKVDDESIISFSTGNFLRAYDIYVDSEGFIWSGSSSQSLNALDGLVVAKVDGASLEYKHLTNIDAVLSIVRDEGIVWLGTNSGVKIIETGSALSLSSLTNSSIRDISTGNAIGSTIYDIEISPLGEKWFATDKGVSVLSKDNQTWRHYIPNSSSAGVNITGEVIKSPLLEEKVTDIVFEKNSGEAIFVSPVGLSFFNYSGISVSTKTKELAFDPAPFLVDGISKVKFILPEEGEYNKAKIFTITGRLVAEDIDPFFGWDGKDKDGDLVSSGIYQVILYNDTGNKVEDKIIGKMAVVRK